MAAESDFEVGQAALGVSGAERAHAIDDEAVLLDWRLETLLSIPCDARVSNSSPSILSCRLLTSHAIKCRASAPQISLEGATVCTHF